MPSPFLGQKKDSISTILASLGKKDEAMPAESESSMGRDAGEMAMQSFMKAFKDGNAASAYKALKNLMDMCDMDTEDSMMEDE